jgi:hypothetical protein
MWAGNGNIRQPLFLFGRKRPGLVSEKNILLSFSFIESGSKRFRANDSLFKWGKAQSRNGKTWLFLVDARGFQNHNLVN